MNSVLNPEAPEFYPHLTTVTQDHDRIRYTRFQWVAEAAKVFHARGAPGGGYKTMQKSVRSSNTLPSGHSYDFFKTVTDFNFVSCQLSENVVQQSNQIIATELPAVKLKRNEHENNTEKLIDANDSLLDRININIDTSSGVNDSGNQILQGHTKPTISSWNHAPVIAKIKVGSATFIGAKNITRPQLNFKDHIDNSENLWVPKISDKLNNIKPLALNILYNEDGKAVGYEHPYKVELDLYHPPSHLLQWDNVELQFPPPLDQTILTYVDTEAKLDALIEHLTTVSELAVDLEHHSYRTYQGITCLIQISTDEGGDFIIDTLAIREHIHKLNLVFTNPKKIKVFHGAESDVIWLQRDFGVYLVGLFDTHQAAKVLNLPGLSLKYLLMKYCRVDADKKFQLADWRIRPLPEELAQYARMDTHYLLYIWRKMRAELLNQSAAQSQVLLAVFDHSRQICGTTYNKEVMTECAHMPLYIRSKKSFNSQQMAALKMLYKWRDAQARSLDESTAYLLPNHMLLSLAESLPREMQGVNAICNPMPPFIKQNLITIHRMLLSCRELPNEPQLYQMPTSIRNVVNALQSLSYSVHDLYPQISEEYVMNMDKAVELYSEQSPRARLHIASPTEHHTTPKTVVSELNAEAKQFVPPFDRYRKYRALAQMEEIKEFKDKEAKIAALGKGNELIKAEVLVKLQQAKTLVENECEEKKSAPTKVVIEIEDSDALKKSQRKRKIATEKVEVKEPTPHIETLTEHKKKEVISTTTEKTSANVKQFSYKNADYKKFYNDSNKELKQRQPKMKFKKHKK